MAIFAKNKEYTTYIKNLIDRKETEKGKEFVYQELLDEVQDSLHIIARIEAVQDAREKYETALKEAELAQTKIETEIQKAENLKLWFGILAIVIVVLLIFIILYFKFRFLNFWISIIVMVHISF